MISRAQTKTRSSSQGAATRLVGILEGSVLEGSVLEGSVLEGLVLGALAGGGRSTSGRARAGRRPARRLARGFTLIEMMVVVCLIATLAALASPSIVSLVRDQRTVKEVSEMMNAFRSARVRAVGRGTAVRVQFKVNSGLTTADTPAALTVDEAFALPAPNFQVPNPQCKTTKWGDAAGATGTGSNVIYYYSVKSDGAPATSWAFTYFDTGAQAMKPLTVMPSVCFSANGRAFRDITPAASPTWIPAETLEFQAQRIVSAAPIGLVRSFKLFGNGTVRTADCTPGVAGPCR